MYADKNQHHGQRFTAPLNLRGILARSAVALGFVKVLAGSVSHSESLFDICVIESKVRLFFTAYIYSHKCQTI